MKFPEIPAKFKKTLFVLVISVSISNAIEPNKVYMGTASFKVNKTGSISSEYKFYKNEY